MVIALIGVSMPQFLLIYLLSFRIHIFPAPGYVPISSDPLGWASHLVLPWATLAFTYAAAYSRIMRSSMLDVVGENFVLLARAKGLTRRQVVVRHTLRRRSRPS